MYCPSCGTKTVKGQKYCVNCGAKLLHTQSTVDKTKSKSLFQKIAHTSLDLMSAQGDKWRKNTELLPDDCWILLMNVSKGQASSFIGKHNLPNDPSLKDMIEKGFFNYHSSGLWIWVAEKQNTDQNIFNRVQFDYNQVTKNSIKFVTDWDALLDHLDKLIPEDIEPSFAIAEVKMLDGVDNNKLINKYLTSAQLVALKSDFKGAIYRGYLLHRFFKY